MGDFGDYFDKRNNESFSKKHFVSLLEYHLDILKKKTL